MFTLMSSTASIGRRLGLFSRAKTGSSNGSSITIASSPAIDRTYRYVDNYICADDGHLDM